MTNLTRLRLILVDLSGLMKERTHLKQNVLFFNKLSCVYLREMKLFAWVPRENSAEFAEKTYSLDSAPLRLPYPKKLLRVIGGKRVVLGKLLQSIGAFALPGLS